MMWAFEPPKPKEAIETRRSPALGHGVETVGTYRVMGFHLRSREVSYLTLRL
jgi:hypothetical protein